MPGAGRRGTKGAGSRLPGEIGFAVTCVNFTGQAKPKGHEIKFWNPF